VTVALHIPTDPPAPRIAGAVIDLRREPFDDPSTILDEEVEFDASGTARLTVAPGDYSWLLLQQRDFYVTPAYSADHRKKNWLRIEQGRNQGLHFEVRRKVRVAGRVIEADTGKPLRGMSLKGELSNGVLRGWDDPPADLWSFAGWAETDEQGRFTIDLAAGLARVSFHGNDFMADREFYEVSVASDGSTVIPDIKVRPLRKVVGVVRNPDGTPASRAVVRLRGKAVNGHQPVLTDGAGRFVSVTLRPRVTLAPGSDAQAARDLHRRAHEMCFIARSVAFPVTEEPDIRHEDAPRPPETPARLRSSSA